MAWEEAKQHASSHNTQTMELWFYLAYLENIIRCIIGNN
jgi:hypothetical protein